jgi:hypothetical protein
MTTANDLASERSRPTVRHGDNEPAASGADVLLQKRAAILPAVAVIALTLH